ncbi:MAG TPA: helix-turn-helix domain-containing protein [Humisphaera sp.]|nr:helix-turn-helix domain-containing protein [Humisphaera sp.]
MTTATLTPWKPGMDLPYVVSFGEGSMLAIALRAAWLKPDRSGQPLLLPPAVRAIDRLRALFTSQEKITPGFIISLREALRLTQGEFGQKLGVSKMTVSRWECGRMRPSEPAVGAILKLQTYARRKGVKIDGQKRTGGSSRSIHSSHSLR